MVQGFSISRIARSYRAQTGACSHLSPFHRCISNGRIRQRRRHSFQQQQRLFVSIDSSSQNTALGSKNQTATPISISPVSIQTKNGLEQDTPTKVRLVQRTLATKTTAVRQQQLAEEAETSSLPENDHNQQQDKQWDHENWKEHPALNPTITFPTWAIPTSHSSSIQAVLSSPLTQPYLATRHEIIEHVHPRPKLVQTDNSDKVILLHPETPQTLNEFPLELQAFLTDHHVRLVGPPMDVSLTYQQFSAAYILEQLLPVPAPTSFETIGHVAHLNLREQHLPYAKLIGTVFYEVLTNIETVLHKVGNVAGPYRTYDYEVLAGRNDTNVLVSEHGIQLKFDLSRVYWCTRLAQERQCVLDEIQQRQVVADAFCGVGALLLRAAQTKNCTILANDWNPKAVEYLQNNFERNKLQGYLKSVTNHDAYDFLMDLGLHSTPSEASLPGDNAEQETKTTSTTTSNGGNVVHHVLLNFPLKAPTFLGALRWWSPPLSTSSPRLHVYTFAREDPETQRSAEDVAIDLIASELVPSMGGTYARKQELDNDYNCRVVAREVRDVAPGKIVFCVSFTATPALLRVMQGDFS